MWFFDWFHVQFWNLRTHFQNLGDTLNRVPALGGYFASPFWWIATFFWNLSTASQTASSWSDSVTTTASTAWQKALAAYNYAHGYLTAAVQNALNTANRAWDYARNTVYNLANSAWLKANEAYNYASGWLLSQITALTATFWSHVNTFTSWRDGFVSQFWSQINAIGTRLNEIRALIPSQKIVIDWVESTLGYLTTKTIALVTTNARTFADPLWYLADAVVGKLTEYRR